MRDEGDTVCSLECIHTRIMHGTLPLSLGEEKSMERLIA